MDGPGDAQGGRYPSAALDAALADCDALGVRLDLCGDRVSVRGGPLPDDLRESLQAARPELVAYLARFPRPEPDPVRFVTRSLDLWHVPADAAPAVGFWASGRPAYRLTPRVWHWVGEALQKRWEATRGGPTASGDLRPALALYEDICWYVNAHFRPDQVRRAVRSPAPLPDIPPTPGDAEDNSRSTPAPSALVPLGVPTRAQYAPRVPAPAGRPPAQPRRPAVRPPPRVRHPLATPPLPGLA